MKLLTKHEKLTVEVVHTSSAAIGKLYTDKTIPIEWLDEAESMHFYPHMNIILCEYGTKQSALGRVSADKTQIKLINSKMKAFDVSPRNKEQALLLEMLLDDSIPLQIVEGRAGTGKTLLACAAALHKLKEEQKYSRIILTKPMDPVGRISLGALPGGVDEKFSPYLLNFKTTFEQICKENMFIDDLFMNGDIECIPIQLMRGASFANAFVIADEVQNLDYHEMKTLTTRIGEGSKLVLMGDLTQRDRKIDMDKTGLHKLVNSEAVQNSPLTSYVKLMKCERSALAQLMADIFEDDE